ncbi:MAG: ADP-forming succinate--CoA ligase subunit beta [Candidatus Puniceispirillum sp.]|nr:ADP-forming succinate--CoA ligase subunit beta [Candidatus Pelagibacter sp.]MBA4282816.1 ADP-forming succinate--CoA ligase subunit beta [Candidatus Puniceispirillum sp.]
MNIHEYQAKQLLQHYNVSLLRNGVATTSDEAVKIASEIEAKLWVVKAQVHAGGRGKAGGVVLARSLDDVKKAAEKLLKTTLITHQTGHEGEYVESVLIEEGCDIAKEFYISFLINRDQNCISLVASSQGGMDIEQVAHDTPDAILTENINPLLGLKDYVVRKVAFSLNLDVSLHLEFVSLIKKIYKAFVELDAMMLEINPLVLTKDNQFLVLDTKASFDENALYRHPNLSAIYRSQKSSDIDREAQKHDLNYVKLDGSVGCMVNGAGLAMATMDMIHFHGGTPANFLDVGGGATAEKVAAAFKIICSDPHVKSIFINIFGGIMRCDVIAEGILKAIEETSLSLPLVVRLQGTNRQEGLDMLEKSGLKISVFDDFDQAAASAVRLSK